MQFDKEGNPNGVAAVVFEVKNSTNIPPGNIVEKEKTNNNTTRSTRAKGKEAIQIKTTPVIDLCFSDDEFEIWEDAKKIQ